MTDSLQAITMPKWGMTMTEGRLAGWLRGVGDRVEAGQEIFEVETEKITNVVESHHGGQLRRILVAKGETVPVGALIGVLASGDVPEADIDAFVAGYAARGAVHGAKKVEQAPAPRIVEAGAHRLNVFSAGSGEGVPVLFLHGFGSDQGVWLFNQDALGADRPVHLMDLPAHGGSAPSVPSGAAADIAAAVCEALDVLELDRLHLVGHSLGGAVALLVAASAPQRVASLTLIAPVGLGPEISARFIEGFLAADRRGPMKEVLSALFADPSVMTTEMVQNTLRFKRTDGVSDALGAIAANLLADGRQALDLRDRLSRIEMPVLVIWGDADAIIPVAHCDGLPTAVRVERIADAGHMPMTEAAATVNRLLAMHLAEADQAPA